MVEREKTLIEAQRQMLRDLCRLGQWKPSQMAAAAGLAPSTVNKFLAPKGTPKHHLSSVTVAKLVDATGVRLRELHASETELSEFAAVRRGMDWRDAVDAMDFSHRHEVVTIPVVGAVGMGDFDVAAEWPAERRYSLPVTRSVAPTTNHFGIEVYGPVMDQVYSVGTILICEPLQDDRSNLRVGRRVICRRTRPSDARSMLCVREYAVSPDGSEWLVPKSSDPRFKSWPVGADSDGCETVITAIVVGSYQREP